MAIEVYWVRPLENEYPMFNLECLEEFQIEGEEPMRLSNFKSRLKCYNHIQFKKDYLKYVRWSVFERDGTDGTKYQYEMYIKNQKLHNLGGPAEIETEYHTTMFSERVIKKKEEYFIDGWSYTKEDFYKSDEVREAKLNRILGKTKE